jgi:hypothetical protein
MESSGRTEADMPRIEGITYSPKFRFIFFSSCAYILSEKKEEENSFPT